MDLGILACHQEFGVQPSVVRSSREEQWRGLSGSEGWHILSPLSDSDTSQS